MTESLPLPFDVEILTPRCRLRAPSEADLPHVWSATRVPGFNDGMLWGPPRDEEEMCARLAKGREAWEAGRVLAFTIEARETGAFLGRVGIHREAAPGEWTIGFWIHPECQRRGYATEAARAAVRFGIDRLGAGVIRAAHAAWNVASRRVLERIGMRPVRLDPTGFVKHGRRTGEWVHEIRREPGTEVRSLDELQPSQLYVHAGRLERIEAEMRASGVESFAPVPVKRLGEDLVLTDGHTRAVAAHRLGAREIRVCREEDELDREAYRICVGWCREEGVRGVAELAGRVVNEKEYERLWLERCGHMHDWLAALGGEVTVVMDRPLGSRHPREGFEYPVNYGCVPGTRAPDGHEIDAYVLGVDAPLEAFMGTCIAVIERLDDVEAKLVVVPAGTNLDDDEIRRLTHFQEQYFETRIVRGAGGAGE